MNTTAQIFRIFVSSTFNDLKAERNALQAYVFPRLRELCEQHGARFQPIDLRWGVSNEASLDQQAMNICLGEIARCQQASPRPNFIVLLGDRYGWMPPPAQIPEEEFRQIVEAVTEDEKALISEWYTLDENAVPPRWRLNPREEDSPYGSYDNWQPVEARLQQVLAETIKSLNLSEEWQLPYHASATHQEINSGALQHKDAPEHVFCFFRNIQGLPRHFSAAEFQQVLFARLKTAYPAGLSEPCQTLAHSVLDMQPDSTPKAFAAHIQNALDQPGIFAEEKELLQFIRRALSDFTAADYINQDEQTWTIDEDACLRLDRLKKRLTAEFSQNVFIYPAKWTGGELPTPSSPYRCITNEHIGSLPGTLEDCLPLLDSACQPNNLCEAVWRSLGRTILSEIEHPHKIETSGRINTLLQPHAALDEEGLAHHKFAEERLRFFVGRTDMLAQIAAHLTDTDRRIFGVTGEGGTGKSALLAQAIRQAQETHPNAQLVYRFIGATPASSDGRSLLEGLCREISRRFGVTEADIPSDYRDLAVELEKRMALASAEKPLILFMDSLDQLSASQGARSLTWMPQALPAHVYLIVSTRAKEDTFENLKTRQIIEKQLGGLSRQEGDELLSQWLLSVGRTLQPDQRQEVLNKFEQSDGNPLYLKLAFEEARLWNSFQPQEELAVGVNGIIRHNMFNRLQHEGSHGQMLVSHALGYLAASRTGLAEDELVDLLSRDLSVYEWFFKQTYHLPPDLLKLAADYLCSNPMAAVNSGNHQDTESAALAWLKQGSNPSREVLNFLQQVLPLKGGPRLPIVLWSRLSFDLAPYLTERLVDGSSLLYFYHRELGDVSRDIFLNAEQAISFHEKLADYFRFKADPAADLSWSGGYRHGLSELPYHLASAGKRDELYQTLTDFCFLEHKAEEVGIISRMDEGGHTQITSDGVQQLQQDFELAINILKENSSPERGNAPLIVTAKALDEKLWIYCPVCNKTSPAEQKLLGQVITCPQEGCQTRLKLNPFVIKQSAQEKSRE